MLGPLRVSVAPPSWMAARLHLYLCIVNRLSGGLCFGCSPAWPLTYICMREAARCHGTESSRCERKDGRMARTETELSELRCWGLFKKADLIRSCCGMTWPRRLHWQLQRHTQRGFGPYAEFSQSCPSCRKTELPIKYSTLHMGRNIQDCLRGCCRSSCMKPSESKIHHHIASKCYRTRMMLSQIWLHVSPWSSASRGTKGGNCSVSRGLLNWRRQSWKIEITNSSPSL